MRVRKKERKHGFDSKFFKIEKRYNKTDFSAWKHLFYFHLVHCSFIFGHGWLHSNQVCKTCQIVFVQVGVLCAAWWNLRELPLKSNNSCIHTAYDDKGLKHSNLDEDSFDMLYKNYCRAAIPDPIWTINVPYERKINMLSSTDNNVMILSSSILRDLGLNLSFLFFYNSHCIWKFDPHIRNTVCLCASTHTLPICHKACLFKVCMWMSLPSSESSMWS